MVYEPTPTPSPSREPTPAKSLPCSEENDQGEDIDPEIAAEIAELKNRIAYLKAKSARAKEKAAVLKSLIKDKETHDALWNDTEKAISACTTKEKEALYAISKAAMHAEGVLERCKDYLGGEWNGKQESED